MTRAKWSMVPFLAVALLYLTVTVPDYGGGTEDRTYVGVAWGGEFTPSRVEEVPGARSDCGSAYQLADADDGGATLRVAMHVFDHSVTPQDINDQIEAVQRLLIPQDVKLSVEYDFVVDSRFRSVSSETEVREMKQRYADRADVKLNIYVTDIGDGVTERLAPDVESDLSEIQRGIIIDGKAMRPHKIILTRSIAECLGLPDIRTRRGER